MIVCVCVCLKYVSRRWSTVSRWLRRCEVALSSKERWRYRSAEEVSNVVVCVCVCPCVDVMRPTSELSVMFVVWRVNSEDCLNDILCCVVYDSCADTHL